VIRVAATADVHLGRESAGCLRPHLEDIDRHADVLLIAGDLTTCGHPDEARVLAAELAGLPVPAVAVLGNHDHHAGAEDELRAIVEDAGVLVLEGESAVIDVGGGRLGIAGAKGFGGGFAGACAADFGEAEMKRFVRHTKEAAASLGDALGAPEADARVALLHYSPVEATLRGERPEIFAFLGSYLLAEAIDHAGADLVLHGHAHAGAQHGITPGGVPVRNVAQPVIGRAYKVFVLHAGELDGDRPGDRAGEAEAARAD
jgi:Icc-related predicted phosphoesterase